MNLHGWWEQFRQNRRQFIRSKPGCRFIDAYHRRSKGGNQMLTSAVMIGGGAILILVGSVLVLVPGAPGIVLSVPGLVMIASRSRKVASGLDWLELECRRRLRGLKRRLSPS